MPRPVAHCSIALLLILCIACAEPPSKEMNQAQGAIDAARAAGAEQYAATELAAAVDALKRSDEAAAQRDYRLALNHAIDSRERAQNAAKSAGVARAQARGDAERLVAEASTLLTQARGRLDGGATEKLPRRTVQEQRETIDCCRQAPARSARGPEGRRLPDGDQGGDGTLDPVARGVEGPREFAATCRASPAPLES